MSTIWMPIHCSSTNHRTIMRWPSHIILPSVTIDRIGILIETCGRLLPAGALNDAMITPARDVTSTTNHGMHEVAERVRWLWKIKPGDFVIPSVIRMKSTQDIRVESNLSVSRFCIGGVCSIRNHVDPAQNSRPVRCNDGRSCSGATSLTGLQYANGPHVLRRPWRLHSPRRANRRSHNAMDFGQTTATCFRWAGSSGRFRNFPWLRYAIQFTSGWVSNTQLKPADNYAMHAEPVSWRV